MVREAAKARTAKVVMRDVLTMLSKTGMLRQSILVKGKERQVAHERNKSKSIYPGAEVSHSQHRISWFEFEGGLTRTKESGGRRNGCTLLSFGHRKLQSSVGL